MSFESIGSFSGEDITGGQPTPDSIQPVDCTLALIAGNKAGYDVSDLSDRITEQGNGFTSYDCKACFAKLTDAGFANVIGSMSCRALFRADAERVIAEN